MGHRLQFVHKLVHNTYHGECGKKNQLLTCLLLIRFSWVLLDSIGVLILPRIRGHFCEIKTRSEYAAFLCVSVLLHDPSVRKILPSFLTRMITVRELEHWLVWEAQRCVFD